MKCLLVLILLVASQVTFTEDISVKPEWVSAETNIKELAGHSNARRIVKNDCYSTCQQVKWRGSLI